METRTVEFFTEKVKQIDAKIEKCFKAFEECLEHLHHYKLKDGGIETETTYVSVASMVTNIQRLEELRKFYIENINLIEKAVIEFREKQ